MIDITSRLLRTLPLAMLLVHVCSCGLQGTACHPNVIASAYMIYRDASRECV